MRDVSRIDDFCEKFAEVWKTNCPDWRFGQMVMNILGEVSARGRDPFFPEEDEMMQFIEDFFKPKKKVQESPRKWVSIDIDDAWLADGLRIFLKNNSMKFETSGNGGSTHFEVFASDVEVELCNKTLDSMREMRHE